MTARHFLRLFTFAAFLAMSNGFTSLANAQQVEFQLTRIPTISTDGGYVAVRDINNLSMVVGSHTPSGPDSVGYVYDHAGLIGPPRTVHSLDEWIPNFDGWSSSRCSGINDAGQIVGLLESTIDGERVRAGF